MLVRLGSNSFSKSVRLGYSFTDTRDDFKIKEKIPNDDANPASPTEIISSSVVDLICIVTTCTILELLWPTSQVCSLSYPLRVALRSMCTLSKSTNIHICILSLPLTRNPQNHRPNAACNSLLCTHTQSITSTFSLYKSLC